MALAALGCSGSALAQDLPVHLVDGATWTITSRRDTQATGPGGLEVGITVATTKSLIWHAPDRLVVTTISADVQRKGPPELLPVQSLSVPVDLEVDEFLTPVSVRNMGEVVAATRSELLKSGMSVETLNDIVAESPDFLKSVAMGFITRDVVLISRGQDVFFEEGRSTYSEDQARATENGQPVTWHITNTLDLYDPAAGRAVWTWSEAPDPASLRDSLIERARRKSPESVASAEEAAAQMHPNSLRTCRSEIDIRSGFAVKIDCTQSSAMSFDDKTIQMVDRHTITQTLPETTR
ncbi:hypothetical protein [Phenylobacterium sp.]|uniref:hypothetical protein n=1 Tax=Phenylobacterium sp. TaxID=1871053 RepID=UPI00271AD7EC|nr:hypothetical protein [Phenylobacterium sp.]MDO8798823.1 hypothetical protein [Phenylobacterium sp.]